MKFWKFIDFVCVFLFGILLRVVNMFLFPLAILGSGAAKQLVINNCDLAIELLNKLEEKHGRYR